MGKHKINLFSLLAASNLSQLVNFQICQAQIFQTDNIKTYSSSLDTSFGFSATLLQNAEQIISRISPDKNYFAAVGAPRSNPAQKFNDTWAGNSLIGGMNFCYFDDQNKIECDSREAEELISVVSPNPKVTQIAPRYNGFNVQYNPDSNIMISCAPASINIKSGFYASAGYCQIFRSKNLQKTELAIYEFNTDYNQGLQNQKMFGYQVNFDEDNILFTAPTAWNEIGSVSLLKNNGQQSHIVKPLAGQQEFFDSQCPRDVDACSENWHHGMSLAHFTCGAQKFVAVGTAESTGKIAIYEYAETSGNSPFGQVTGMRYIRSPEASFGYKFGFGLASLTLNDQPFLLISSPFSPSGGKLFLYNPCQDKFENERLVDIPKNIKSFGYSLENIGNFDSISGDEILVGAPNDHENLGSISILATRNLHDKNLQVLKYVQTIENPDNSGNSDHLGLTLSKFTKNLDGAAGDDILVAGHNSISTIFSRPFYSLVEDVKVNFPDNLRVGYSGKINVFDHADQESIEVCFHVTSNVKKNNFDQEMKMVSTLTLDALREFSVLFAKSPRKAP